MADKTTRSTTSRKKKAAATPVKKTTTRSAATAPRRAAKTPASDVKTTPKVEFAPMPAARRRPVFQAGTWISIFTLIALVALTYYFDHQKKTKEAEVTPAPTQGFIFTEADGVVSGIEIKPAEGETVKIARDDKNAWTVVLPIAAEANQGAAEAAASQLTALLITRPLEDGKSPDVFGLDKPAYTIKVEYKGGKTHTLEIGDETPSSDGYYVRVDQKKIMITDVSGIEALLQLKAAPPYLNTPTPTALPTETPVPTVEATATSAP
jgi:hypothetical protein